MADSRADLPSFGDAFGGLTAAQLDAWPMDMPALR